jgi:predicted O-linked N-acetylglucosamine transferase (SPINDLY family)
LTDAIADPPGEPICHTEELVRLPGCFCCYGPPIDAPAVGVGPCGEGGHITFGAPHKLLKLNDRVLELWARVLQAVSDSRLLICRNTLNGETLQSWQRQLTDKGIAPDRLELRQAIKTEGGYLSTYQGMDILLDSFPWSAHATACEALWMGVPLVTLSGNRFANRMCASVLTALGLTDLVAANPDQYVAIAVRLAKDRCELTRLRAELRERIRRSQLCDTMQFTKNVEESYRWMWQRWCQGRPITA